MKRIAIILASQVCQYIIQKCKERRLEITKEIRIQDQRKKNELSAK